MMMQFSPLCFCLFACFLAFFSPSVFLPADFPLFPFLLLHFPSPSSLPLHCKLVQGPSPVVESCLLPPPPHFPFAPPQPFISLAPSLPSSPLSILTANTRGADGGGGREKKLDWFELPLVEEGRGGRPLILYLDLLVLCVRSSLPFFLSQSCCKTLNEFALFSPPNDALIPLSPLAQQNPTPLETGGGEAPRSWKPLRSLPTSSAAAAPSSSSSSSARAATADEDDSFFDREESPTGRDKGANPRESETTL